MIRNPVLRGFEPDPSIVRVGADFHLATSTFEWWPGVRLHHSRDLVHWRPLGGALDLDLRGVPDSGGVWAPSLSHHDGRFWLVYSVVRTWRGAFKDVDNLLVTAPEITGPWSAPVHLNATGFDPSLFHDDDGRRWLLNVRWDFRPGHPRFAGIAAQEYDHAAGRLVGAAHLVATSDVLIEGPNLYRHGGGYLLMVAEGGTGWEHGIRTARGPSPLGPFTWDPEPLLTTRDARDHPLQKAGHGELVETADGEWFLAHLAARPVPTAAGPRTVLGRETCLQRVEWTGDGGLRLAGGGHHPAVDVPAPAGLAAHPWPPEPAGFGAVLGPEWSTLRRGPDPSWLDLGSRPGWLRLRGRQSLHSAFDQSLVARRLPGPRAEASVRLECDPPGERQQAGLVAWYSRDAHYYLRLTGGARLGVVATVDGAYRELAGGIAVGDWPRLHLRVRIDGAHLRFAASPDGRRWTAVGPELDTGVLSDDHGTGGFTGTLVGLAAHDLDGTGTAADFTAFTLRELACGPPLP